MPLSIWLVIYMVCCTAAGFTLAALWYERVMLSMARSLDQCCRENSQLWSLVDQSQLLYCGPASEFQLHTQQALRLVKNTDDDT